jgi:hypothetical protein
MKCETTTIAKCSESVVPFNLLQEKVGATFVTASGEKSIDGSIFHVDYMRGVQGLESLVDTLDDMGIVYLMVEKVLI